MSPSSVGGGMWGKGGVEVFRIFLELRFTMVHRRVKRARKTHRAIRLSWQSRLATVISLLG